MRLRFGSYTALADLTFLLRVLHSVSRFFSAKPITGKLKDETENSRIRGKKIER